MDVPPKPEPISNPLAAGSDSMPLARSASSLSKTGSPNPAGTLRATTVTTPPRESPSRRARSMASVIAVAASGSGQRVGSASTCSNVTVSMAMSALMVCTRLTHPRTSTAAAWASSRRATAAPATRPIVSRADERPPPRWSRSPYLAS